MKRKYISSDKLSALLFWTIWFMYAVVYMTKNCYSAAMASIVSEGIMTKSETGLITAVFYLVYGPLQFVGGRLADRYKPEKIILIGLIGSGIMNGIIFFNQNYYAMLVVWTCNAIVQFGLWPAVFKIISSQLSDGYTKKGVFYISFSSSFGLLLAYGMASFINKWQYNFFVSSILLFACAILFGAVYNRIAKHMTVIGKWEIRASEKEGVGSAEQYVKNPFWESGFIFFTVAGFMRMVMDQGIKTLSPTMLMESYENISPFIANSMNLLIIICSILGIIVTKLILYPRFVKNELAGYLGATVIALPLVLVLVFIGKVHIVVCLLSLAMTAVLTGTTGLFSSYLTMRFAKIGREGEAAGIANMAASIGVVVQSYGLVLVADHYGWSAVAVVWTVLAALIIVLLCIMWPVWKRFRAKYNL
ncbi:MAG: MFS transporter [Lachnospiraceae bacterium]|nr:MFS transporter [Lachnospiraceae bacterium]